MTMRDCPLKLKTALFILVLLLPVSVHSQTEKAASPVIHTDGSVTFSYKNPSAKRVKLFCDCDLRNNNYNIERENFQSVRMKPDSSGVFTFTTKPLTPEVYTYQFKTHGRRFVDPDNADSIRVLKTRRSVFVIPGSTLSDLCIKDSLHGRIDFFEIWDTACGKTRLILLYLPPGYDPNEQPYPVLYLLHGINWVRKGLARQRACRAAGGQTDTTRKDCTYGCGDAGCESAKTYRAKRDDRDDTEPASLSLLVASRFRTGVPTNGQSVVYPLSYILRQAITGCRRTIRRSYASL